jgi:hypothetical protein
MLGAFIFGTLAIVGVFIALVVVKPAASKHVKMDDAMDKENSPAATTDLESSTTSGSLSETRPAYSERPAASSSFGETTMSTYSGTSSTSAYSGLVTFATVVFLIISTVAWFQGLITFFKTMGEVEGSVFGALVSIAHLLAATLFWLASFAFWLAVVLLDKRRLKTDK